MNHDDDVVRAADALTSWLGGVSNEIKELAESVTNLLERNLVDKSKIDKDGKAGLDEIPKEFLARNSFAVGAGAFFATESVEEGVHALEWWTRKESGALETLDCDLTPGSNRYYDYEKLPFFSTAASTGEQTLWGPYIDFLGFEEYILTFTAPFSFRGNFMGVAGCDIRVKELEPLIMPALRLIPGDAALINASSRVILGNSGMYLAGERIKSGHAGRHRIPLNVPHLGLSLIFSAEPRASRSVLFAAEGGARGERVDRVG